MFFQSKNKFLCSLILIICMILTSCQSAKQPITGDSYREPTDISSFGQLPSTTGKPTSPISFTDDFPLEVNAFQSKNDEKSTGKWIMADGEGRFGYMIPSGMVQADAHIEVGLIHATEDTNELERNVRVQMSLCSTINECEDPLLEQQEFISAVEDESIIYEGIIPEEMDRLYHIRLDILQDERIEDTLSSYMYVPREELHASLEITEETSEDVTFSVENHGPTTVTFGKNFIIEQKIDGKWHTIPYQSDVQDIGIILYPSQQTDFTVDISSFPKGSYRFIKKLHGLPYELEEVIAAPFTIK